MLDVAIDGADEVDPALNVVKGRGGALLREKVRAHSRPFVFRSVDTKYSIFGIVEESDAALLREEVQPILPNDVLLVHAYPFHKGLIGC